LASDNRIVGIDRELCVKCLSCSKACPNNTLKTYGIEMTVEEIMAEIRKDRSIYLRTGGGVTLSGGDCLSQHEFVLELLKACKRSHIHACVESELCCPTEVLDAILPYTSLLMTDIKHMDSAKHRKYTGLGNKQILANIGYLAMKNVPMIIRIPVIPGYNDDDENIKATAMFMVKTTASCLLQLQILPYRPLGLEKYKGLGLEYPMKDYQIPPPGEYLGKIRKLAALFQEYGLPAQAGTTFKVD
jgi:pyruvate formate lyase activating enzyme